MDAQKIINKWSGNAARAGEDYKRGIQDTTVNPMERAAAAEDKYQAKLQESFQERRFSKGLRKITKEQWMAKAINKGGKNYVTGINEGKEAYAAYMTDAAPKIAAIKDRIRALPNVTEQDAEARMVENMRAMRSLKKNR